MTAPTIAPHLLRDLQIVHQAYALANELVLADIQTEGIQVHATDGLRWYDVRPMLDPRERCNETIDKAVQVLAYAEACGLIKRDALHRHMVCITAPGRVGG